MMTPLPCKREMFDIPEDVAYFNCAYMSPLLRDVHKAASAGMGRELRPWEVTSRDFFEDSEHVRNLTASLINAKPDDIAMIPAASYGVAVAAANILLRSGQEVLVLEGQHTANTYSWQKFAAETGSSVLIVPRPHNGDWTSGILQEISTKTAVAALPNCHSTDGVPIDLVTISERLRDVGASMVIDATHSLGALDFDIERIKPDFMIAGGYKWLLGPYSTGVMYVAPEHQKGRPLDEAGLNRKGSEDFAKIIYFKDDYQPGARRYDVSGRGNFALLPGLRCALEKILEWGVPSIYGTLTSMTQQIRREAHELGYLDDPEQGMPSHYISIEFPEGVPTALMERFSKAKIHVGVRGNWIRITPHVYNSSKDIARLLEVLRHFKL